MEVQLVSPEQVLYTGDAKMVVVRTLGGGDIAFEDNHAPFLGALAAWPARVKFEDGSQGEIDLASELWGAVFEPLKDPETFRNFEVAEYGTVAWPNGADLAPEFLYERARVAVR